MGHSGQTPDAPRAAHQGKHHGKGGVGCSPGDRKLTAFAKASPYRPGPTPERQRWLVELDGVRFKLDVYHRKGTPAVVRQVEPRNDALRGDLADVRAMGPRLLMRLA